MKSLLVIIVVAATTASLAIVGCAKKNSTMRDPEPASATEPTPPPSIAHDLDKRTRELREQIQTLESHIRQLPGKDDTQHRQIMQQVFADLTQTLPMVVGSDATGAFRQQLRILQSAQTQLASGSSELAAEPTIDTGLRAAHNALANAQARLFYESQPIAQTMEQLRGRIAELDSVRGPMHRLVVTQATDLIGQTLGQMADAMEARSTGTAEEVAPAEEAPPAKEEAKPAKEAPKEEAKPAEEAPKKAKPTEEPAAKEEAKSTEETAPAEDKAATEGETKPEEGDAKPAEESAPADGNDMNK